MIQKQFAETVVEKVRNDASVLGLAVGGSWITHELDEYSDLDLILVTKEKISNNKTKMLDYAESFGPLLAGGEHVGEPRLLICLYEKPLLHVDIKFLVLDEFYQRVETPVILWDREKSLQKVLDSSKSEFPYPDNQWIEDRFWIWIHFALLKIGRGEYFEAHDFLAYLRMVVLGPLLHIKNKGLPKGVRKVESLLPGEDLDLLKSTLAVYNQSSLVEAIEASIHLYKSLRTELFDGSVHLRKEAEDRVVDFLGQVKHK